MQPTGECRLPTNNVAAGAKADPGITVGIVAFFPDDETRSDQASTYEKGNWGFTMIGRVIGTYKIVQKLGEGGMGAVYKGVDTMLDREVAIKALKPELASQTAIVERFRSEAVTLAKLNHPNIATLYSLFRQDDELYMVLEYVRGETLDTLLARRGALPTEEVIPVFCQILDGINHAHEYGIIHRDIKPANMILTETGILKVLDFGIARLLGSNRMTLAGNIIGTLEYMAPEQVKGLETDARSDTYALGMMLYEVLTGRTPFKTDNEFELMKLQTESMPPNPRSINSSIPSSVEAAIMRSIQKNPDDRFQTAGDFREFLHDAGFVDRGSLRRSTSPNQINKSTEFIPPISKPAAAPHYTAESKETRLAESVALSAPQTGGLHRPSVLDRLTGVHYVGAGFVAVVIIAFMVIIPIVIFSGGFSQNEATETRPANTNSTEKEPRKVTVSTPEPAKEVDKVAIASPLPEPTTPAPITVTHIEEPSPLPPVETPKPANRTKAVPPTRKTEPVPKTRPAKPRGKQLRDARCALTGDC